MTTRKVTEWTCDMCGKVALTERSFPADGWLVLSGLGLDANSGKATVEDAALVVHLCANHNGDELGDILAVKR